MEDMGLSEEDLPGIVEAYNWLAKSVYEAIVKGRHQVESGLPESFKVLISELKSLCLNIELLQEVDSDEEEANTESVSLSEKAAVSEEI